MDIETSFVSKIGNSALTGSDLHDMDQRRYIDPGNYLDLMELLSTFTSEIERSKTKLEGQIGQGNCHLLLLLSFIVVEYFQYTPNFRCPMGGVSDFRSESRWMERGYASPLLPLYPTLSFSIQVYRFVTGEHNTRR